MNETLEALRDDNIKAWRLAEDLFEEDPSKAIALQCRYALVISILNDPDANLSERLSVAPPQLPSQELIEGQTEFFYQGLTRALRDLDSEVRANLLDAVGDYLPQGLQTGGKRNSLDDVRAIKNEYKRLDALKRSLHNLLPNLLPEALAIAEAMPTGLVRVLALKAVAPKLPPDLLLKALDIAMAFQGENTEYCRALGLCAVANWLPEKLKPDVLADALASARALHTDYFRDSVYCTDALSAVSEVLPEPLRLEVLQEALDTARTIEEDWCRCMGLAELAPKLPEAIRAETFKEAINAVTAERGDWAIANALLYLLPNLPSELLPAALTVARRIRSERDRTKILVALAPNLPSGLMPEALIAAKDIQSERDHIKVLVALAPNLPSDLVPDVLATARSIQSEGDRARVLAASSASLPSDLVPDALAMARDIQSEGDRIRVLVSLADKRPEMIPELLATVRDDRSDRLRTVYSRASILTALAPSLPSDLLFEAFVIANSFRHKRDRLNTLMALSSRLSTLQVGELFSLWQTILHTLSSQSLEDFVDSLLALTKAIYALGGREAVADVLVAISKVKTETPCVQVEFH